MKNSICKGKSVKNQNKCKKITSCKVAKGTKRTFCRKKHNKTTNAKKSTKSPMKLKITPRLRRSKRIRENNDGTSARRKQNLRLRNPGIAWKPAKSMFSQNQIDYMKMK